MKSWMILKWIAIIATAVFLAAVDAHGSTVRHAHHTQCPLKGCNCGHICTKTFDCARGQHPALFVPSHASLVAQNSWVDEMGLTRYNDKRDLTAAIKHGELVYISDTPNLKVKVPKERRYSRPWVILFLNDISTGYAEEFHSPLLLDSAVRTRQVQTWLRRHNRNAAPIHGEAESSHMAGATVDIGRHSMTPEKTLWVENYLLNLDVQNKVIVEEERACFHVM